MANWRPPRLFYVSVPQTQILSGFRLDIVYQKLLPKLHQTEDAVALLPPVLVEDLMVYCGFNVINVRSLRWKCARCHFSTINNL